MAKKNLAEAAAEILGGSVTSKRASAEKFGTTKGPLKNVAPGNTDAPSDPADFIDRPVSLKDAGMDKVVDTAPKGPNYPNKSGQPSAKETFGLGKNLTKGATTADDGHSPADAEEKKNKTVAEDTAEKFGATKGPLKNVAPGNKNPAGQETGNDSNTDKDGDKVSDAKDKKDNKVYEDVESASADIAKAAVAKLDIAENLKALFGAETGLSEDFMTKAANIFTAAVTTAAIEVAEDVETIYVEKLDEITEAIQADTADKVDQYLNYVVESWLVENEVAIEKGLRAELTEDFIAGLRTLFIEHHIDIPEDKVSVVEELAAKVAELENKLNEETDRAVKLTAALTEGKRTALIKEATEGLTDAQAAKLETLAENLEYTNPETFAETLKSVKGSYFTEKTVAPAQLDEHVEPIVEETDKPAAKIIDPSVARYAANISKRKGR
jgi:hypothetical protein